MTGAQRGRLVVRRYRVISLVHTGVRATRCCYSALFAHSYPRTPFLPLPLSPFQTEGLSSLPMPYTLPGCDDFAD